MRPQEHRMRSAIEARELECEGIGAMPVSLFFSDEAIEHAPLIETAHFHEPVNDGNALANRESSPRNAQGDGAKINIGGEPAVQRDFGAAGCVPLRERREVEIREAHRLFKFVDKIAGQEHQRHMGLPGFDVWDSTAIGAGIAKKSGLLFKGWAREPFPGAVIPGIRTVHKPTLLAGLRRDLIFINPHK